MQSGPNLLSEQSVGVNYRALNDLFNLQAQRKGTIDYEISVQMIEIYNEQVRDLLQDSGNRRYPFIHFKFSVVWSKESSLLISFHLTY
jgi:hypothetical protein